MKKPTPEQVLELRAAYPQGVPRIDYRAADFLVEDAASDSLARAQLRKVRAEAKLAELQLARARATAAEPEEGGEDPAEESTETTVDETAEEDEEGRATNEPITVAISSEMPVLRYDWWEDERYWEVLDHERASVDLSYARDGLPFVSSHRSWDADAQHGIAENVRVDKDRKLRGDLRMSQAKRSQEIAQDMRDGIRKKVSVGYIVGDEYTQEKGGADGIPIRRYTSWMPIEVSTVPIPADYDVGIGRAQSGAGQAALARFLELHPAARPNNQAPKAEEHTMPDNGTAPAGGQDQERQLQERIQVVEREAREGAQTRIKNISDLASAHGCQDRLSEWIGSGKSELEVTREIAGVLAERLKKTPPTDGSRGVEVSEEEYQRFSYAKAVLQSDGRLLEEYRKDARHGKAIDFGFENEIIQEALRNAQLPAERKGFYIPFITTRARSAAAREMEQHGRAIDSATATTGGAFKLTQPGDFISMVRNATSVLRAGVSIISGLTGPLSFPKQTGSGAGTWRAENPGSELAVSDMVMGTVTLSFKTIQSTAAFTRQALFSAVSGNYDLDIIVRNDLAAIIGLGVDLAGLNGLGSSNQPLGVLQDTSVGTATALGTNGGTMAWANWVDLETTVGNANASGLGRFSYITNSRQRARAKTKAVLDATASGVPIWGGAMNAVGLQTTPLLASDGIVNGYPAIMSNQVPSNLTKGTATTLCSAVVFGAFEHLLMGIFGNGFEMITDPYSKKGQNMIEVTAWSFVDFANRYPVAFAKLVDAL